MLCPDGTIVADNRCVSDDENRRPFPGSGISCSNSPGTTPSTENPNDIDSCTCNPPPALPAAPLPAGAILAAAAPYECRTLGGNGGVLKTTYCNNPNEEKRTSSGNCMCFDKSTPVVPDAPPTTTAPMTTSKGIPCGIYQGEIGNITTT